MVEHQEAGPAELAVGVPNMYQNNNIKFLPFPEKAG